MENKILRIIFMGTPDYAVPCLEMLVNQGYKVVAVVTNPDKPVGRKQSVLESPPVKLAAIRLGINCILQPEKLRSDDFINKIQELESELIITIAYGKILPKAVLDLPASGCINVHGSLLPKYRGAAPIQWSIINGDKVAGVTTMYMDEGMDTGDMLLKEEIQIGENITYGQLYEKLKLLSADILKKTLDELKAGTLLRMRQDETQATKVSIIKKEMGLIDWNKPAQVIHNLVRGTDPWPGAYTTYGGKRIKIWKTLLNEGNGLLHTPGEIIEIRKESLVVATGDGLIEILELQPESGKRMPVSQCGHNIDVGGVFG